MKAENKSPHPLLGSIGGVLLPQGVEAYVTLPPSPLVQMPARLMDVPHHTDARGELCFLEAERTVPFPIKRIYYMHGTTQGTNRGGHAHKDPEYLFIAIAGSFTLKLTDTVVTQEFTLNTPNQAVYVPQGVWRDVINMSPDAVCMVLCSAYYEAEDYIRDYTDYTAYIAARFAIPDTTR